MNNRDARERALLALLDKAQHECPSDAATTEETARRAMVLEGLRNPEVIALSAALKRQDFEQAYDLARSLVPPQPAETTDV